MAVAAPDVENFIEQLAGMRFANVFNPYSDTCLAHDLPDAAIIRRENLQRALSAAIRDGVVSIWVARDLGYLGGRRTGLAMTDDVHIAAHSELLGAAPLHRATKGPRIAERTATVIWDSLQAIGLPIFLWNVFPLHPHYPGDEMSNRLHTRHEREVCRPALEWLINTLQPKNVVAIGRDAQRALQDFGIVDELISVRHPSYGGQREFTEAIQRLYGHRGPDQSDLFFDQPA